MIETYALVLMCQEHILTHSSMPKGSAHTQLGETLFGKEYCLAWFIPKLPSFKVKVKLNADSKAFRLVLCFCKEKVVKRGPNAYLWNCVLGLTHTSNQPAHK